MIKTCYPFISPQRFFFSLLFLYAFSLSAQPGWTPANYYGIQERDKQNVFIDDFEDNRNRWDIGSLYLTERIEDGDYYCASSTSHAYTKRRAVSFDINGNYEFEIRMRYIKSEGPVTYTGLVFGRNVQGSEYAFLFDPQGNFKITRTDRGRSTDLRPWSPSQFINRYTYNSFLVRKVADQWYFFVNQELVAQMPSQPLYGNECGFTLSGMMTIEVDFMRVSELSYGDQAGPQVTLLEPLAFGADTIRLSDRNQIIRGRAYDPSGLSLLTINGQPVTVSQSGIFTAALTLPEGFTRIDIIAQDQLNNRTVLSLLMTYRRPSAMNEPPVVVADPRPSLPSYPAAPEPVKPSVSSSRGGSNYLLLIGVNNYTHWNKLHNAVKDCKDVAQTLIDLYQFDQEHVISLFNEQATRENILETLEMLQDKLQENDNLLIYYAGHGYYDESSELGYWVPVEARLNKVPDYILNSTIHDYLRTINTRNTFLIADACYSGSLFATYRGLVIENAKSRWAFTSGDIEKVWDGQPGQNSPFAKYLIRYLRSNTKPRLPANELIEAVGYLVHQSTSQNPKGSPLKQAGDDGGVFVFEKK